MPKVDIIRKRNFPGLPGVYPWRGARLDPLQIDLERAVSLRVRIRGANGQGDVEQATIWSTATTVGEALEQEGLVIYEGDLVQPTLGQPLVAGLAVTIERSKPVVLSTAAHNLVIRTRGATVADLLAEQGLVLVGLDRVEPALSTPLTDDLAVRVTRVRHAYEIEEEVTPFTAVWEPDPELEIDNQRLDQEGVNGITRHRYRIVLEDSQPITRTLEDTWLAQTPVTKVLKYGSKIELRTVDTPQGALTYWRKIRMYATSYSADEAGTPRMRPGMAAHAQGARSNTVSLRSIRLSFGWAARSLCPATAWPMLPTPAARSKDGGSMWRSTKANSCRGVDAWTSTCSRRLRRTI